jgi:hypothetical protein
MIDATTAAVLRGFANGLGPLTDRMLEKYPMLQPTSDPDPASYITGYLDGVDAIRQAIQLYMLTEGAQAA